MIDGLINDLRKMSITGLILFFVGFIANMVFIIFLGLSFTSIGFTMFSLISKEWTELKKKL